MHGVSVRSPEKRDDPEFPEALQPGGLRNGPGSCAARREDSGFLFRIDPSPAAGSVILVQSAMKPDWDYAFHNAGYLLAAPPEVKTFDPRFAAGQSLRFRLVANPTTAPQDRYQERTRLTGSGNMESAFPYGRPAASTGSLAGRDREGFLDEDSTTVQPGYIYVNKTPDGSGQRLRSVRYEGILTVTDARHFQDTIARGIGPGKAFGFGLLSLCHCKTQRPREAT